MHAVLTQNEKYLRDVFGSPLRDGTCVLDADREVGYVRLEFGTPSRSRLGVLGRLVQRHPDPEQPPTQRQGHERPTGPAHREGRMTWHTATVATDRIEPRLLTTIRSTGGTVAHCRPQSRRRTADLDNHRTVPTTG